MNDGWWCGAFHPAEPPMMGYRCTRPYDHQGRHEAWVIEEEVVAAHLPLRLELCERMVASWPRRDPDE